MSKLLATVLVLLACTPAFADARYTRTRNLRIDVNLSDRTKPIAPPPAPPTAKPITANDAMRVQEATQPFRKEQEAILEKLLADTPDDDPEKADLMFRLAEHYANQHRFWRHKAIAPTMPAAVR